MKTQLMNNTNQAWAEKTDISVYAQRQAQSCEYLEKLFVIIIDKAEAPAPSIAGLFEYLTVVHRRQYDDLAQLIDIPKLDNKRSFYFDSLYAEFNLNPQLLPGKLRQDELVTLIVIQGVSYLRGYDRYRILRDYTGEDNILFIKVWNRFYSDAKNNSEHVFAYLDNNFDNQKVEQVLQQVIVAEDLLMQKILNHKQN